MSEPKFNIGAWKHYNSFDEDCYCHLCNQMQEWIYWKLDNRNLLLKEGESEQ